MQGCNLPQILAFGQVAVKYGVCVGVREEMLGPAALSTTTVSQIYPQSHVLYVVINIVIVAYRRDVNIVFMGKID